MEDLQRMGYKVDLSVLAEARIARMSEQLDKHMVGEYIELVPVHLALSVTLVFVAELSF